jgi:hypothetical protein
VTSMVEMYENGASVAEIAKTFRAPLSVVEKRVAGTVRKAIVFAPPKPAMIVWEAPEPRIRRQARRAARGELIGKCSVCWGPVYRRDNAQLPTSKHLTCSRRCGSDWELLRYYIDPAFRSGHRRRQASYTARNPQRHHPDEVKHAANVLTGRAKKSTRLSEPKRRGTKVYFAWQRAQRKRALNGASR